MVSVDPQNLQNAQDSTNTKKQKSNETNPPTQKTPEDAALEAEITALKTQIISPDDNANATSSRQKALEELRNKIQLAAKSMTSVPKPLKILHPFFEELSAFFETRQKDPSLSLLADILSCLSMVCQKEEKLCCLEFKLKSGNDDIEMWGDEYVRHLSREILADFERLEENDADSLQTKKKSLVLKIVDFHLKNSAETEAVDLLFELEMLEVLQEKIDGKTAAKIATYLIGCLKYIPSELAQFKSAVEAIFQFCEKAKNPTEALKVAFLGKNNAMIQRAFSLAKSDSERLQMALVLGQLTGGSDQKSISVSGSEAFVAAMGREKIGAWFEWLAKELSVSEAKKLEDIYKSHLIDRSTFGKYVGGPKSSSQAASSARENLAATFVNAFVHAAYGSDALLAGEGSQWVFQNKDDGMISATASLGMVHLWSIEKGFQAVDFYAESATPQVKAGALLGFALVGCGVRSELNASTAMLLDPLEGEDLLLRTYAAIGLGLCAAGTVDEDLAEAFDKATTNRSESAICAFSCLSLGLVFQGSCRDAAIEIILDNLIHFSTAADLNEANFLMMASGLAFVFVGTNEKCEGICEALEMLGPEKAAIVKTLVKAFAYAGSNNVLHFHEMLKNIKSIQKVEEKSKNTEKGENSKEKTLDENTLSDKAIELISSISVLGLALVSMGEKIGKKMAYKTLDDLLRYENVKVRRAVPLAMALMFVSQPDYSVLQTLSKLSHDPDEGVALNSIFALGIVAAGTNNSRVAKTLRNLAVYYQKDADHLFVTRISQGLVHLGKGLHTLNPYHLDGSVLNIKALCGLLVVHMACFEMSKTILGKQHFLLFFLAPAIRPRMLATVDEEMQPLNVLVRVGQAVDSVRLTGESKTISGFQTHRTPVLLSAGEKAELVSRKLLPLSCCLEGVVILTKNPDFAGGEEAMSEGI